MPRPASTPRRRWARRDARRRRVEHRVGPGLGSGAGVILRARFTRVPARSSSRWRKRWSRFSSNRGSRPQRRWASWSGEQRRAVWRGGSRRPRSLAPARRRARPRRGDDDAAAAATAGRQRLRRRSKRRVRRRVRPAQGRGERGEGRRALGGAGQRGGVALCAQLGELVDEWTVKKEKVGKLKTTHFRVKLKKNPDVAADWRGACSRRRWSLLDGDGHADAGRVGKDAKARLSAIAGGQGGRQSGGRCARTQERQPRRDLFYYLNLTPVLGVVGTLGEEPRLAALARAATTRSR